MKIKYETQGKLAVITINRPEKANAVDLETKEEFKEALYSFKNNDDLLVAIITGAGDRVFSSGADMHTMLDFLREHRGDGKGGYDVTPFPQIEIWKPLIAAVNGAALAGGLLIALLCDLRIASEKAIFGLPEIKWGWLATGGLSHRLQRNISYCKAMELHLLGTSIDAQEAYRIGLVNKVVPHDQVLTTAIEWAEKICENPPLAVKATKEAVIKSYYLSLEGAMWMEMVKESYLFGTEDVAEGLKAFREKRKPVYKGR